MAITTTVPTVDQTVTPLPPAPSRLGDPASFAAEGDALLSAMPTMVTQENTQKSQINTAIEAINDFAAEANALATEVNSTAQLAEDYATKTGSSVEAVTYSAKEFAIGDLTVTGGSAKAWAIDTASPDGTSNKSAKSYAIDAQASAEASENSRLAAEAILDNFDDRYLGAKAVEPTLDNDGNPLQSGALYYNTTSDTMYVRDNELAQWVNLSFNPSDHGSLSGLADDDHPQYLNDARGDIRYYTKAQAQEKLESGTNIKSINGMSLLGGGDVSVGNTAITSTLGFALLTNYLTGLNPIPLYYANNNVVLSSNLASLHVENYLYLARSEFNYNQESKVFVYKINLTTYLVEAYTVFSSGIANSIGENVIFKFVHDGTNLYSFTGVTSGTTHAVNITKFNSNLSVSSAYKVFSGTPLQYSRFSKVHYDATYWYFVLNKDTTYDSTVLVRIKRDNTETKYIELTHGTNNMSWSYIGFANDSTHVYFSGSAGANSKIVKVDKASFTVTASTEFTTPCRVVAVDSTYVYVDKSSNIVRLDKTTLTAVDTTAYTLTPNLGFGATQVGDYVYGQYAIMQLSTLDMYKVTRNVDVTTLTSSQYNEDVQCTYMQDITNIHLPFVHINYSNFVFGTSYYSQNSKLSFTMALCTKSTGTNPTTSSVMTISSPTTDSAPLYINQFSAVVTNPLTNNCTYIDQI